jgi:hypothetical protein
LRIQKDPAGQSDDAKNVRESIQEAIRWAAARARDAACQSFNGALLDPTVAPGTS